MTVLHAFADSGRARQRCWTAPALSLNPAVALQLQAEHLGQLRMLAVEVQQLAAQLDRYRAASVASTAVGCVSSSKRHAWPGP